MKTRNLFYYIIISLLESEIACIQYRYTTYLDKEGLLNLDWDVNYITKSVYFKITAHINKQQAFGFGFSDYGDLTDADFAIYRTDMKGNHHFQDTWTDDEGLLHADHRQDYILTGRHIDSSRVVLEFHRKFRTCDNDDYQLDNGTTHVIFFIASMDNGVILGQNISNFSTGLQRIQLLKPDINEPKLPKNTWSLDVTAPSVHVPGVETTYWWYTTTLPTLSTKHHIIKYEGIISKGNENLVHHMEVFHCEIDPSEIIHYYNGPGLAEGKPPELEACRKVIGAWAMGAKAFALPDEAGTPVGGPGFSKYVLLEIHYNNPGLRQGLIDSSGIRFYITSHLRKYDAGIMELGLEYTNKMAIPPRQKLFPLTGYCISECTAVGLPHHGIKIFASQLHTHLTGKKVYTKHVRNNVELPELNRDNHYSPHFQEIRAFQQPVEILPGDALITTCEDSTLDRGNATVGGFSIREEMCVNYVHYYPKVNLEVCKSSIDTRYLNAFFDFMRRWENQTISPTKGVKQNYQSINWTPLNIHLLKTLYNTSPLSMQCNQSDGTRFPGDWEGMPKTKIDIPFLLSENVCRT